MKFSTTVLAITALSAASLIAADGDVDLSKLPPASKQQNVTYEKDIKPIFEASCFRCHGPEKPKGDLRLDSLEGALKGSEHGQVIVPGKSAESKLVIAVARITDEPMPPAPRKPRPGAPPPAQTPPPPLTPEQVSLVRAWIDQGAK